MNNLLFIKLNEINFDDMRAYGAQGHLPELMGLMDRHGVAQTTSEKSYEELEPWIQWVTAHTGLTLAEHNVFRLGDIVKHDIPQIWEHLEGQGLKVGAISPMNAKNRTRGAAFFVPDPWTPTELTAGTLLKNLYSAVAQAVNDNAQDHLSLRSKFALLAGAGAYARAENYGQYVTLARGAKEGSWSKAMFLDLLLGDIFIKETKRTAPDFATLFLNAGAHIQHHYMFNSAVYKGNQTNPDWVIKADQDPVLDVYRLYDRIVGQVRRAFPQARLMLATGLHQDPHPETTFYWRLKDHAAYLTKIGVPFARVEPRMSRDFFIECESVEQAAQAERILSSAKASDGSALFEVDNRGRDLFVMLVWSHDIGADYSYTVGNRMYDGLRDDVAFVAIKNGQHNGIGYFLDTGVSAGTAHDTFPLADIPIKVCEALGVPWRERVRAREIA